jgi:hypothetical protein
MNSAYHEAPHCVIFSSLLLLPHSYLGSSATCSQIGLLCVLRLMSETKFHTQGKQAKRPTPGHRGSGDWHAPSELKGFWVRHNNIVVPCLFDVATSRSHDTASEGRLISKTVNWKGYERKT